MPAKRRRSFARDSASRLKMWDKKMNPEIYSEYLKATKPLAIPKVAKYQATHEYLISMVKSILGNYPEEFFILQEYMWYAQKMWKLVQSYSSEALKKEANALFLWYLAKGRNEMVLRGIARALGINIEDTDIIVGRITMKVIAKGTLVADGTEQTVVEYVASGDELAKISGYLDLQNMVAGDEIIIRVYVKMLPDADYKLLHSYDFSGKQEEPALYFLPKLSGYAFKVTLQQTSGTYKSFNYLFTRGS